MQTPIPDLDPIAPDPPEWDRPWRFRLSASLFVVGVVLAVGLIAIGAYTVAGWFIGH